jgi:hypothetical protein
VACLHFTFQTPSLTKVQAFHRSLPQSKNVHEEYPVQGTMLNITRRALKAFVAKQHSSDSYVYGFITPPHLEKKPRFPENVKKRRSIGRPVDEN